MSELRQRWEIPSQLRGQLHVMERIDDVVAACSLAGEVTFVSADGKMEHLDVGGAVLHVARTDVDGKRLVAIAQPAGVLLLHTQDEATTLRGHAGQPTRVGFCRGLAGTPKVVSADEGGWVRVWDLKGTCSSAVQVHRKAIHTMDLLLKETGREHVITASDDRVVTFSSLDDLTAVECRFGDHVDWIEDVVVAGPDDGTVTEFLTVDRRNVVVRSLASETTTRFPHDGVMCCAAAWLRVCSAARFVTGHRDGGVRLMDERGDPHTIMRCAGPVVGVHIDELTGIVFAGSTDGRVRAWNPVTEVIQEMDLGSPITHVSGWTLDQVHVATFDGLLHLVGWS